MRRHISSGSTFERDIGYSRAVVDGEWVFVSGTTGLSGLSGIATARPQPGSSTGGNAGSIPYGAAVQYDLPITIVIADNGLYGTIRMHQEREYPGRVSATVLRNPSFPGYARAFGGFGVTVQRTEDFPAAFAAAQASGKPAIVHLKIDPEAITPAMTLSKIRAKSLAEKNR